MNRTQSQTQGDTLRRKEIANYMKLSEDLPLNESLDF